MNVIKRASAAALGSLSGRIAIFFAACFVIASALSLLLQQAVFGAKTPEFAALWRWGAAIAAMEALILAPVAAYAVYRALSPLRTITRAAWEAALGETEAFVHVKTGDELQTLGEAFNALQASRREFMYRLERLALTDEVTDLPNREGFRAALSAALVRNEGRDAGGTVLFLDLDRFKRVNDSLGLSQGDRLLETVAMRISSTAHDWALAQSAREIVVSRHGSDEFAVFADGARTLEAACSLAEALSAAVRAPIQLGGHTIILGVSMGAAFFPDHGGDPETLLRRAAQAMTEAKRQGGDRLRHFTPAMDASAAARLSLEMELRRALEEARLEAHYQPKIRLRDGAVVGAEALIRWPKGIGGAAPAQFIAAAEELGLILDVGAFMLKRACRDFAGLGAPFEDLPVAVNVSAAQFDQADFADAVFEILAETGLAPNRLELEITETVAMRDPARALAHIEPLREAGARFAVDDFGIGYSNLSILTRLPLDVFKIDQSFIADLTDGGYAPDVVRTILAMARTLNLCTVAEGVETEAQRALLQGLGCGLGQGFLFSPALPFEDFQAFLDQAERRRAIA